MAVSIWWLYIGIFLCASGVGVAVGATFIFYWGIKKLEAKQGNSYTENNFTANINHHHASNDGSGEATVNEGVSRDYVSNDTLEENR